MSMWAWAARCRRSRCNEGPAEARGDVQRRCGGCAVQCSARRGGMWNGSGRVNRRGYKAQVAVRWPASERERVRWDYLQSSHGAAPSTVPRAVVHDKGSRATLGEASVLSLCGSRALLGPFWVPLRLGLNVGSPVWKTPLQHTSWPGRTRNSGAALDRPKAKLSPPSTHLPQTPSLITYSYSTCKGRRVTLGTQGYTLGSSLHISPRPVKTRPRSFTSPAIPVYHATLHGLLKCSVASCTCDSTR